MEMTLLLSDLLPSAVLTMLQNLGDFAGRYAHRSICVDAARALAAQELTQTPDL